MPRVTVRPTQDSSQKEQVKAFLLEVLKEGHSDSVQWPSGCYTRIFIDDQPYGIQRGFWQIDSGDVYLPKKTREGYRPVGSDLQLAILVSIAQYWDLTGDAEIKEAMRTATIKVMAEVWNSVGPIINYAEDSDGRPLNKFALNQGQLAALIVDTWRTPNGEQVELNEDWVQFSLEV